MKPRHRHYDPGVPVYFQIENLLRRRLETEWTPGARLPSEAQLAAEFRVTRSTMRRALAGLEGQKVIVRRKGSGTFVSSEPLDVQVSKLTGFIDDLMSHGLKTRAKVLECRATIASTGVAQLLALPPGEPVLYVSRLRYVEDKPLIVTEGYLPWDLGEKVMTEDLEQVPIIHLITKKYRIAIPAAEQTVEAVLAEPETAGHLEIAIGSPVLRVERTYYGRGRKPKYYSRSLYRADRYKFTVTLKRR